MKILQVMIAVAGYAVFTNGVGASSPIAEVLCAPSSELSQKLTRQMGEDRVLTGLRGPEQVMELWRSDRGDWTLVMTYTDGKSCIVAMGENWENIPEPAAPA